MRELSHRERIRERIESHGGKRIRINGPFLTDRQVAVIKRWIARGAPNN
jgi:hypothetical protein